MIKFGTSGWRGIIADDFTFGNVRTVTQAIARYVNEEADRFKKRQCGVMVGYDTRFLSENFARASAEVLAANSVKAYLCKRNTPTPVISHEIINKGLEGGINFTASHNPPEYNGLKFSPAWGGPALPETTQRIEKYATEAGSGGVKVMDFAKAKSQKLIEEADPRKSYVRKIKELVDLGAIRKSKIKVAVDVLHGTGEGYLDEILESAKVRATVIGRGRDVLFRGRSPEPSKDNLGLLREIIKKQSCRLGVATDGDADRFGIIDSDGSFINPNQTIAVLLYHLVKTRKWKGVAARSVMTTHLVDKIAAKFGIEVRETPVGFKYIGDILVNEKDDFVIGGEESGGLTIRGHVPEKDGILACLLVCELAAVSRKPIKGVLNEIEKLVGPVVSDRVNFHLGADAMDNFRKRIREKLPDRFGEFEVAKTVTLDGYKFMFKDGSWFGMRLSGTEPVVRLYVEADSNDKVSRLKALGKYFINGGEK
ncbi:MAG: phosphoglucomutase/phosphomannomutase family protein [Endomicrobiales bacterium]|nr:phosphoglucomutase/phosphomannomutase family protein [Endomicrobiales bacterium]